MQIHLFYIHDVYSKFGIWNEFYLPKNILSNSFFYLQMGNGHYDTYPNAFLLKMYKREIY